MRAVKDHPRSRGVYVGICDVWKYSVGSSPLARGLLQHLLSGQVNPRIIPARAGFTSSSPWSPPLGQDHPRSRGVYENSIVSGLGGAGSSPLARGLPVEHREHDGAGRIIPARAGFTRSSSGRPRRLRDHPRSRGVYPSLLITTPHVEGSSPLARGLLVVLGRAVLKAGIIPARAGFTAYAELFKVLGTDHPRSRGVYQPVEDAGPRAPGSSPLARGLP